MRIIFENSDNDNSSDPTDGTFYELLVGFAKGTVSAKELEKKDPLISNIRGLRSQNKESSILILKFKDDNDYYDLCNLDDDDLGFVKKIFNPYYGMELQNSYSSYDNWYDGYVFDHYFNDENRKKFDEIVFLLDPTIEKENGYYSTSTYELVDNSFERNIQNIVYEFSDLYNDALIDGNKDYIIEDLGELFFDFGIHKLNVFYKYFTTVGNLISLYDKFDPTKRKDISELLKTITSNLDMSKGYWDYIYEVNLRKYFDYDRLNRVSERELDDILEKIEDDESETGSIKFIRDLNQKILSKYKINKTYTLPSDQHVNFVIVGLDKENKKIEVIVNRKGRGAQKNKFSIPEFFQFLNTYPLFK